MLIDTTLRPSDRRVGGWRRVSTVSLSVIALLLVGLVPSSSVGRAHAASSSAADSFDRTVSGGWGTAATGGAWAVEGPTTGFRVGGGYATLRPPRPGTAHTAVLSGTALLGTETMFRATASVAPTGFGQVVSAVVRRSAAGEYRLRMRFASDGSVRLSAARVVAGTETVFAGEPVAPGAYRPSGWWQLKTQAVGAAPTTLRVKAWPVGAPEPAWQLVATDSTAGLQTAGAVGVHGYVGASASGTADVHVDSLTATAPTTAVTSPTSPTPTSPTTTSPTTTSSTTSPTTARQPRGTRLGTTAYPVPATAVHVSPTGSDMASGSATAPYRSLSKAVAAAPGGATIVVRGGVYRESVVYPYQKRLTIQSFPGEVVWLDGSVPVTGFVASGTTWRKEGWTATFDSTDSTAGDGQYWSMTNTAYPAAAHPDMLWVNGVAQKQVLSEAAVTPGTFFVDKVAKRLVVGSNPTGQLVEATARAEAIYVNRGAGSALRGIGVRRYATPLARYGAVKLFADGVVMEDVVVQDTATRGVGVDGHGVTIRRSVITGHGQLGIGADESDRLVVEHSVISGNNVERFNTAPVAGGIKVTSSRDGMYRNNTVSGNLGHAVWLDSSCLRASVVRSDVMGNSGIGVHVEISAATIVADNLIAENGTGIKVAESNNVKIWNNTLSRNKSNLDVIDGPRKATDLSTPGHDPRYPSEPLVTWVVRDVVVRNNLLVSSAAGAISLFGVEDGNRLAKGGAMVSTDYNGYYRPRSDTPKWVVNWANYGGSPTMLVFTSLPGFRTATGMEQHGIEVKDVATDPFLVDSARGQYAVKVGSAGTGKGTPLPADVAAAVQQPAGVVVNLGRLST